MSAEISYVAQQAKVQVWIPCTVCGPEGIRPAGNLNCDNCGGTGQEMTLLSLPELLMALDDVKTARERRSL